MSKLSDAAAKAVAIAKSAGKAATYTAQQVLGAKDAGDALRQSLGVKVEKKNKGGGK